MKATVRAWTPLSAGACIGKLDIDLPSGLILRGCMVFRQAGQRWVKPPSKPRLKGEKVQRDREGRVIYDEVVSFAERNRQEAFSEQVLAALDVYLAELEKDGDL